MASEGVRRDSRGKVVMAVNGLDMTEWQRLLETRREVVTMEHAQNDPTVHYALAWNTEPGFLVRLPGLKVIFSLGAGVDHLLFDETVPDVPIIRVVDENLAAHMADYVCWRVLDHHRKGRLYRQQQAAGIWRQHLQAVAGAVTVGIMGMGELGRTAAERLLGLGYRVAGWSRTGRKLAGVDCHAGADGLGAFLAMTDILVVLLPHTLETEGIIDYALLSRLRRDGPLGGPVLINAGRGKLQKEADILRALDDGTLHEASLDVFEQEPLDPASPLWQHERVFITPHVAAESDPAHLVPVMLDQMDNHEAGRPLANVVDRKLGY